LKDTLKLKYIGNPAGAHPAGLLKITRKPRTRRGLYRLVLLPKGATEGPVSSMASGLEAFSHNPTDGSVAALDGHLTA